MIDEPLAPHWRYDLGHRKIFEFRSALGLPAEGPAPSSAVFAYGIVPGIARMLTHPQVAAHRDDLRLARVEAVFASELDMQGKLMCGIEINVRADVVSVISCVDGRGARAVATVHLVSGAGPPAAPRLTEGVLLDEMHVDPARCMAFAAATWDLNPAYWDRELAELAGLGGPVAPPGLAFALAADALERSAGCRSSSLDVHFERAARPGDALELRAAAGPEDVRFEVLSADGRVLHGTAVLGRGGSGL